MSLEYAMETSFYIALVCYYLGMDIISIIVIITIYLVVYGLYKCSSYCFGYEKQKITHLDNNDIFVKPIVIEEIGYADGTGKRVFSDGVIEVYYRENKNNVLNEIKLQKPQQIRKKNRNNKHSHNKVDKDDNLIFKINDNNLVITHKKFNMTAKLNDIKFSSNLEQKKNEDFEIVKTDTILNENEVIDRLMALKIVET